MFTRLFWLFQVMLRYGPKMAKRIERETGPDSKKTYRDIIKCSFTYGLIQDQYYTYRFYEKNKDERIAISKSIRETNKEMLEWEKNDSLDRKFFVKYGKAKYDNPGWKYIKSRAYQKRYKAGSDLRIERNVEISRQHYLSGEIIIGHDVLLCKECIIDYSGKLIIEDHVSISEGSVIYSHSHLNSLYNKMAGIKDKATPEKSCTVIKSGAWIGAKCIIMPGVTIGENAVILPGCVITHDVPDKAIVSPGKVVAKVLGKH